MTLKQLREARGLTQRELAAKSGVNQPDIVKWEKGRVPPLGAQQRLAATLGVTPGQVTWVGVAPEPEVAPTAPTQVYIVEGRSGEYDDRRDWIVTGYLDEQQARRHAELLNDWCAFHNVWMNTAVVADWATRDALVCPYDVQFYCDYTGTEYVVVPVPLSVAAPEAVTDIAA